MDQGSNAGRVLILSVMLVVVGLIATLWIMMRSSNVRKTGVTQTQTEQTIPATGTAADVLEIAAEDDSAPWSNPDGTGCANDIVAAAYKAVNVRVVFKVMPYPRAKEMTVDGKIAACFAMSWLPEFEGKVMFPDPDKPLYVCKATLVRKRGSANKATSAAELVPGTTIGTVIDYEYPKALTDLEKKGIIFESANSEETNLNALALGRLDFAVINVDELKSADLLFARAGVTGEVAVAFEVGALFSHIGFSVAHPRGAFARAKYNQGYGIIRADGTLDKIRAAWRAKQGASP